GYFTGECNHHITAYALLGMVSEIFLYGKIISDCVCSAICNDHSFALTVNLITAVFQEIGHNHFRLLGNSIAMLLVILEQCTGCLSLNEFWIILRDTNQLKCLFNCSIVRQHIQNVSFFNGLAHGIHMERSLY